MYLDVFDRNPFGTNCWMLGAEGSEEAIVVDPGFEPARLRRAATQHDVAAALARHRKPQAFQRAHDLCPGNTGQFRHALRLGMS